MLSFLRKYWWTFTSVPQFHLSYAEKELLEREPRGEAHQEILRRAAKDLPIYTRTMSGGTGACGDCERAYVCPWNCQTLIGKRCARSRMAVESLLHSSMNHSGNTSNTVAQRSQPDHNRLSICSAYLVWLHEVLKSWFVVVFVFKALIIDRPIVV